MKISASVAKAWKACTASPAGTLKFLLTEGCLTLLCLAPLLFLTKKELAPAALACPVLWLLIMLPARVNAAMDMENALRSGEGSGLGSTRLVDFRNYGQKLGCGLKRLFFLALWSAPLIVLAVVARAHISGETDSFTVLRMIKNNLGGGDQITGLLVVAGMAVAALLILVFGCAFHSGARHAFAQGEPSLVNGHHGGVLLAWLASLLSLIPLLAALAAAVIRYLPAVSDLNALLMNTVELPDTRGTLMILAAGALLTIPLLPLRSMISAAYVDGLRKRG